MCLPPNPLPTEADDVATEEALGRTGRRGSGLGARVIEVVEVSLGNAVRDKLPVERLVGGRN